jgi:hypothetical protein
MGQLQLHLIRANDFDAFPMRKQPGEFLHIDGHHWSCPSPSCRSARYYYSRSSAKSDFSKLGNELDNPAWVTVLGNEMENPITLTDPDSDVLAYHRE